ncbi:YgfZ/GcvT domain-containing protein [Legionella micdadei]|uniref:Glycine cleavage T protein n=1 Tax=Legionella micdadei TaxID=451 RepID=A0A098GE63_LEGMI|nr:folate-binding protein YgfZ [Legionella micdadei]ARG97655.1 folate-binding protein YgfZ [Legionella micdadei]ARH00030.1 folate-binding protein YgfZ [Legionella micdadei]KTD27744.1 glycine cleavage T protein [Legionella micdadei]NSL17729.1 folate-binding protein YgfZ [Legionella micdadei]CEG60769.1 Glycine cleavage T protein [Legionella micdadei]
MNFSEYFINNRPLSVFTSLASELNFERNKNYLFDLSYLGSLSVLGERAVEFLQGQVSCDVRKVTDKMIQQGAMCNLKGRVLALFDVVSWHGLQLILANDLLSTTQSSLNKAAMLSRVQLEQTTSYQIYGFYLANAHDLLPENITLPETRLSLGTTAEHCCYSLGNQLYIILVTREEAAAFALPFIDRQQIRGSLAWHQLQLRHKHIEIYPETRGLFLPHRIDLHLSGQLSFDKGCYKGQEIVARTHYRAKLKHGLALFVIETDESLIPGKKVFLPNSDTEIGELIDLCPLAERRHLVAISILHEYPNEVLIESHSKTVVLKPFA